MATKPADAKPAAAKSARKTAAKPIAKAAGARRESAAAETPAPVAAVVAPENVGADIQVMSAANSLKLKALVDQVAEATKAKPKLVKEVIEAALLTMGRALSEGQELNLPPFGKARVSRQKPAGSGEMLIVKLKRGGAAKSGKKDMPEGVAAAEE